jgi:dolichol-phosphate mannosyltransferase
MATVDVHLRTEAPADQVQLLSADVRRPLVVLPTYNEAENIAAVIERVGAAVPSATLLVVDDGSPDGTADLAVAAGASLGNERVEVLRRGAKSGLGTAYRAGFRWGIEHGHDALIQMDSDFQHDPDSIPEFWPWYRRNLSRWGNRYASAVLGLDVADATGGFRAYRADFVARLDLDAIRADGYGFQIEMTYQVRRAGGTIVEVPIQFGERHHGESKMSGHIVAEALVLVTWWAIRDRVRHRSQ